MLVTGRVVGAAQERPWTDDKDKEHLDRSVSVVDDTLRSVVEITIPEKDDEGWARVSALADGAPCSFSITRMRADRFGRVKMTGALANGHGSRSAE